MIRLLLLILLLFLAYTVVSALLRALPGRPGTPGGPKAGPGRQGEEMVQDPECGTYVPRSEAVEKVIRGHRHYFCSSRCRDAYSKKA